MTKLWFRARRYGWGWEPASIEGWLVVLAFFAAVAIDMFFLFSHINSSIEVGAAIGWFVGWIAVLVVALVAVAWCTGERPKWQWGNN